MTQIFDISHEMMAYQAMQEAHRAFPDDEDLWNDYQKAKAQMEVAWLQYKSELPDAA
jgi:hypothetical protein